MQNTINTQLNLQQRRKPKNLIFCFDGTWNDPSDAYEKGSDITNVLKLHRSLVQDDEQQSFYFEGVGTGEGLDKIIGGATGKGANKIRNRGYVTLVENYRPGDKVFVFGFSRGAAIARMFAGQVNKRGLPETLTFSNKRSKFKAKGKELPIDISLLGVFDTVASFGIPVDLGINFQQIDLFRDFTVAENVKKAYHLVALHEGRRAFAPTLMNAHEKVEEIWFPGVHSNVGGGYAQSGISDIALRFMMNKAAEMGLRYDPVQAAKVKPNLTDIIHDRVREDWALRLENRDIHVLSDNEKAAFPPKIHHSVFERIKRLGDRTPPHIERLQGRYIVVND
jgi:uncharacterized protein (DUF2235 family)